MQLRNRFAKSVASTIGVLAIFLTCTTGAYADASITITDGAAFTPIQSEAAEAVGVLNVGFNGRIVPHENTVVPLVNAEGKTLTGKPESVKPADGWRCDVVQNDKTGGFSLANFRPDRAPAFPTAEGFGKYAMGGRGGRVIEVTNLNDSGPGSFRAACEAAGPRTVVFRVSGTIALESKLEFQNPYITIAGQTAPGDGICIKNYQVEFETDHVIIRYMRFRPGDERGVEQDGFSGNGDHTIIDHCSVSWGVDETLSINKASNHTVQWCLVSESMMKSVHKKGDHGYGGLWGGAGGSYHHNALVHHSSRNPRASGNKESGLLDYRNNVVYNWGFNSAYGGELWPRNWVNNYYKPGPATRDSVKRRIFLQKAKEGKMYLAGTYMDGYPEVTADNWGKGVDYAEDGEATEKTLRVDTEFVVAPVKTDTAEEAYKRVLAGVGASLVRDSVDTRIIEEIRTGTAKYGKTFEGGGNGIIDSQKDVGGWPELKSTTPPEDGDHDGMPDIWETEKGLNPADESDGPLDRDGDGYTNLEEYLNFLAP